MKMFKKIAITFSVSLILTAFLSACVRFPDDHYSGDYPELFTVAVNSLLGAKGYSVTEIFHEIILLVIDEDSYGRVMFLYVEPRATSTFYCSW